MIEIEKKYSDYQKNECDEIKSGPEEQVVDPKICPTCTPNPNFKLEANWWEISEGYLNEAECEYHIRVYESDAEKERDNRINSGDTEARNLDLKKDIAFDLGITKLLIDLEKPIDAGIKQQLLNATYTLDGPSDTHETGNTQYKKAWKIRVPAFNFDQIEPLDSEDSEKEPAPSDVTGVIVLKAESLNRDLKRLDFALSAYSKFYSMAQQTSNKFVIRQEQDPVLRINYDSARRKLKKFKEILNESLLKKGYPKIQNTGAFKSKKADKIKITFKEGGIYNLKNILVLPDDGCEKYENLKIPVSSDIRSSSYITVYNFLSNLDLIINDLTAAEEKPWLDWTLEYFYPKYVVDYGNLGNLDDTRAGLECLIENQLGIGNGQVVDTVTSEIMSAFTSLEEELSKQLCKSAEEKVLRPSDVVKPEDPEVLEERERILKQKFIKKYENNVYKAIKKHVNFHRLNDEPKVKSYEEATSKFAEMLDSLYVMGLSTTVENSVVVKVPFVDLDRKTGKKIKKLAEAKYVPRSFAEDLERNKVAFSEIAFAASQRTGLSYGQEILVSEEYQLGLKAIRETIKLDDNSFMSAIKEAKENRSDFDLIDIIPTIGLCGMTKTAGKAMECLLKGVSFDDFLTVLIEKTFEFMEVNTFSLFFNGLPEPVRQQINEAIEKEFGSSMDIVALFGIKNSGEGSEKLKDFIKSKQKGKEILRILKKNPALTNLSEEDSRTMNSILGKDAENYFESLSSLMITAGFEESKGIFNPTDLDDKNKAEFPIPTDTSSKKRYKPERWVLKSIRQVIKTANANNETFQEATDRIYKSIVKNARSAGDARRADRNKRIRQFNDAIDLIDENAGLGAILGTAAVEQARSSYQSTVDLADRLFPDIILEEEDVDIYKKALNSFNETALGAKVDIVFDIVFSYLVDYVTDFFSIDELFNEIKSYPVVDFLLDKVQSILLASCPKTPVIYPSPDDILKSLVVDVCDPTVKLATPVINVPSINYRFYIELKFSEKFREALTRLYIRTALGILNRIMNTLEGSLCNLIEGVGGFAIDGIRDGTLGQDVETATNRFLDALNEAFCNDSQNSETNNDKAEELADALFSPLTFSSGGNSEGSSNKVTNVISSVATQEEFLEAMVARDGEENQQFNKRISNAVQTLAPEVEAYLGTPDQVAYFFRNLGSYLPEDDKERIRDLLEAGIPNLPISDAICLTNDQLDEWNRLREDLLKDFPNPDEIVRNLNDQTLAALEDAMDDVGDLSTDGPFVGPLIDELNKDACNPENILNDISTDDLSKIQQDELTEAFYDNITRSLIKGFSDKNGLIGEALADKEGRKEFSRSFRKLFNPNYKNSQFERDLEYDNRNRLGKFVMDVLTEDGEASGVYPETIAIDQREQLLSSNGKSFDFTKQKTNRKSSKNIVYRYVDTQDDFKYRVSIAASNLRSAKKVFGYNLQVIEKINEEKEYTELNINTPIVISNGENRYLQSVGFDYISNSKKDIRKAAFNSIMKNAIPVNMSHDDLYEQVFKMTNENIVEAILSNYRESDQIPNGYKYGYVNEDLTKNSFTYYNPDGVTEYNLDESEKTLGTFGSSRIVVLDPKLYGGRYSNPPYYVEPRQFTGWMEIATKAFTSAEGCAPKNPPLISFNDISNRTKMLTNTLRNDPRLSQDPDCVSVKPFNLLIDSKNKSKMDGVVRTTIRAYIAEIYLKGYGLFSNLETRQENFDASLSNYIVAKIKSEMSELGTSLFSSRISIKQDRYWYTFLEQSVEAYQRMIDVDGVSPTNDILAALSSIQKGLDRFVPIDKRIKKLMRERIKREDYVVKPNFDYDPLLEASKPTVINGLQAVAFRLTTDEDEKRNFFNGEKFTDIKARDIRFASLKKLRFFQKIYFIKLFEKECTLIMGELIRDELKRFGDILVDGVFDKPYYRDVYKSFFGMKSFFPNSTSRVGLNDFYIDKQTGLIDTGNVPDVPSNSSAPLISATDKPQFIIEKYARIIDKEAGDLPEVITNRSNSLRGVVSLEKLSDFVDENLDFLEGSFISDYFGSLSFIYKGSFTRLMDQGYNDSDSLSRLFEINTGRPDGANTALIQNSFRKYIGGSEFEDFDVLYDETFISPEESNPTPHGTTGESGIKYGLRVCLVLPQSYLGNQIDTLKRNAVFSNLSKAEKSYLFEDGSMVIPISSAEVDVIDVEFENFDPFDGTEVYDLECLINKLVLNPSFTTMFDKLLNIRQATTMTAIYAIESFMPSVGRGTNERTEEYLEDLDYDDSWDGTINKFAKNFLRREFSSLYLANTIDGQSPDQDDENSLKLLNLSNPFENFLSFDVNIPWWVRRRLKTKVYDANGQECADPAKDLT